ncbi:FAD-dependent monooxygenase [Thiomicrorhabdus aquaedulcis]|uniref:FAD-dependent monooxygenase n=1 Tax=Thiomicrorhabdus aquaedulcis TaxID=2211106 RepID=UPI000FD8926C|nr:FAD-dependent monooxygenase [Thiomicrorhabdus aquaedulcis]
MQSTLKSYESDDIIQTDVLISGGGPVGLMLAIGLGQAGYDVMLAERYAPKPGAANSFDGRVLALSHGSMLLLSQLGIWPDLVPFVTEIHHVHVSQKGYLGLTTLHASEVGVAALGYSIQSSDLGTVLWAHAQSQTGLHIVCPASLTHFTEEGMDSAYISATLNVEDQVSSQVEQAQPARTIQAKTIQVKTKLLVGADGTESKVRRILGLPLQEKSYNAFGVVAQIATEQHPQHWAYERFTQNGPVALLPMHGHFHKAVYVCPASDIASVKALDDEGFMALFAEQMGERLGAFTQVSPRVIYPLTETYVEQMFKGRALLMGNASHTQHPVAAQGLNLGIRDIAVFLEGMPVHTVLQPNADIGSNVWLSEYAALRQPDHQKVMGLTDTLISVFEHRSALVGHLRGVGLMAMQLLPSVKKRFSKFAMGGK